VGAAPAALTPECERLRWFELDADYLR